jgi:hypothetical protein
MIADTGAGYDRAEDTAISDHAAEREMFAEVLSRALVGPGEGDGDMLRITGAASATVLAGIEAAWRARPVRREPGGCAGSIHEPRSGRAGAIRRMSFPDGGPAQPGLSLRAARALMEWASPGLDRDDRENVLRSLGRVAESAYHDCGITPPSWVEQLRRRTR